MYRCDFCKTETDNSDGWDCGLDGDACGPCAAEYAVLQTYGFFRDGCTCSVGWIVPGISDVDVDDLCPVHGEDALEGRHYADRNDY